MFETFNDPARACVVRARERAMLLGHPATGTAHYLLAMFYKRRQDRENLAGPVLLSFGMTVEDVQTRVIEILGVGEPQKDPAVGGNHMSPTVKRLISAALGESLVEGSAIVHSGHLLLGLLSPQAADPADAGHRSRLTRKPSGPDFHDIAHRLLAEAAPLEDIRATTRRVIADLPRPSAKGPDSEESGP